MIKKEGFDNLPGCAAEYIDSVIKKMRYRKKIHQDSGVSLSGIL